MRKPKRQGWEDITSILTEKGEAALRAGDVHLLPFKVGTILKFDYEGSPNHFKIKRIDSKRGKVWAKKTMLYTEYEANINLCYQCGQSFDDKLSLADHQFLGHGPSLSPPTRYELSLASAERALQAINALADKDELEVIEKEVNG